jgi:hypothetical protein
MSKSFNQLTEETGLRFGGLQVKGINELYGEQSVEDQAVFAKDAYINMHLLRSALDLGFNVMECALTNEIREMEMTAEWARDVQNVKLAEEFQTDASGIAKMREDHLKKISGGKGYRSPVKALVDPVESGMSGGTSFDLLADPHTPIKKGIRLCSADLWELAEVEGTPQASGSKNVEGSPTKWARGLSSPEGTLHQKKAKSKSKKGLTLGSKGVPVSVESEEESEESENEEE